MLTYKKRLAATSVNHYRTLLKLMVNLSQKSNGQIESSYFQFIYFHIYLNNRFRDGKELANNDRIKFEAKDGKFTLSIKNMKMEDCGTYTVIPNDEIV